jgi:hypothetical protein
MGLPQPVEKVHIVGLKPDLLDRLSLYSVGKNTCPHYGMRDFYAGELLVGRSIA